MNKNISGGGELIDQGAHIVDLSRSFLGNFKKIKCELRKYFWKSKTNVDDNAFLILNTNDNKTAFLHCSCTEWKNKFSFEIFGEVGKIEISGLGGSYGQEKLIFYKMRKKFGKPNVKTWKFNNKFDISWKTEVDSFFYSVKKKIMPENNIYEALENMIIINKCYKNKVK